MKVVIYIYAFRDVHGDMSAIVLRWPATSLNQALELPIHTPPPKGKYRSPEQQAASERAQHRWGQIKMLHVEFYRARRYCHLGCLNVHSKLLRHVQSLVAAHVTDVLMHV